MEPPAPSPASSSSSSSPEIVEMNKVHAGPTPPPSPPTLRPPSSSSASADTVFIFRSVLAAMALSALAVGISALMWPLLIGELDGLAEMSAREGKEFKDLADEIWRQLMHLQQQERPSGLFVPMRNGRGRRELQMMPGDSRGFLDRLERRSYKGRQRIKIGDEHAELFQPPPQTLPATPYWELYTKKSTISTTTTTTTVPSTTTSTTTAETQPPFRARGVPLRVHHASASAYDREAEGPTSSSSTTTITTTSAPASGNRRVFPTNCPRGPPGYPGKPGYDGLPGIPGMPGHKGHTGDEVQQRYDSARAECVKCPAGPPGLPGAVGLAGAPGEAGVNGVPGTAKKASVGRPGPVGDAGPPGANGTVGAAGVPGSPGIRYIKGAQGPKGEQGKSGPPGGPGEKGQDGKPGAPGEPGYQGWPGSPGPAGKPGVIGPEGIQGIPGAERHYCNCPVRTSQLMRLRDQPGGMEAYLGRWKGRLPTQLLSEYEEYAREKHNGYLKRLVGEQEMMRNRQ